MSATDNQYVLLALVENKAGVLARISDLFARRSYNILTLTVAPTRDRAYSRVTIVVEVDRTPIDQIVKQLFKLVNVIEIQEMPADSAIERELVIATINVDPGAKDKIDAKLSDYSFNLLTHDGDQIVISVDGKPSEINALEDWLKDFDVVSLQRSGRIALPKIGHSALTVAAS